MGYQCENGNLIIVPEQAEVVKTIFNLYLDGMKLQQIKEYLERQQIKTSTGKELWATYVFPACCSSAMNIKQWCKENGICEHTYYRNLRKTEPNS